MKPQLEALEDRTLPAVATSLVNGLLAVSLTGGGQHVVSADTPQGGTQDQVSILADGQTFDFSGVTALQITGSPNGVNNIQNNTNLPSTLTGGNLRDVILDAGGNAVIDPGKGKDVVYDLLGTNTINVQDSAKDLVFVNAQSTVTADAGDRVVTFFKPGRTPGAGTITLENGVLYIAPTNNGSSVRLANGLKGSVVLTADLGDGKGPQQQTFARGQVQQIAYFGGTGNDTYRNDTAIQEAAYGSAGADTLVSGFGRFVLLKGSGGPDVLVARGKANDLSGGPNVGDVDLLFALGNRNVFRVDAADQVFGRGLVIQPAA